MKKWGMIFVCALTALFFALPVSAAETADGYWSYTVKEDGTVRIDDYLKKDDRSVTEVVIPDQIDGAAVTELAGYLFSGRDVAYLNKVTVPASIETMGFNVFGSWNSIKEVVFEPGSKIIELPDSTFNAATNLQKVTLPDSLESLKTLAFCNNPNITQLEFPSTLKILYNASLMETNLTSVYLPESATNIVGNPFDTTPLTKLGFGPFTPDNMSENTAYLSYNMVQFGFNDAQWQPGTGNAQWDNEPLKDTTIDTIYIDQVEGSKYWHERYYIQDITHYFRTPELVVNDVRVNDDRSGYVVNATVSINKNEGFELNGMLNAVKYDAEGNRTTLDQNEICTIAGRVTAGSDSAQGTSTVDLAVNEFDYTVMLTHRGYEGTPDNGATNRVDKEWAQQINGYKIDYVVGDQTKTFYYLNGQQNTYPTLEELGFPADTSFTGWTLADGTQVKSGDAISDQPVGTTLALNAAYYVNQAPVITGPDRYTVQAGDKLDLRALVEISDDLDAPEELMLVVDPQTIDTSRPGQYQVRYTVTDTAGASAEKLITIIVEEKSKNPGDSSGTGSGTSNTGIPGTGVKDSLIPIYLAAAVLSLAAATGAILKRRTRKG